MPRPGPKLPLEPLYRALELGPRQLAEFCAITGLAPKALSGYRLRGGLSVWMADRAAVTAGFHPIEVWPEWLSLTVEGSSDWETP